MKRTSRTFAATTLAALILAVGATGASAQTMSYAEAGGLIAKSCGRDIERFCPTVNMGGGALRKCLLRVKSRLGPECVSSYQTAMASLDKRAAAQAAVPQVCRLDAERHCRGVSPGDGHYLQCLNAATKVVSTACQQALADAGWN